MHATESYAYLNLIYHSLTEGRRDNKSIMLGNGIFLLENAMKFYCQRLKDWERKSLEIHTDQELTKGASDEQ